MRGWGLPTARPEGFIHRRAWAGQLATRAVSQGSFVRSLHGAHAVG